MVSTVLFGSVFVDKLQGMVTSPLFVIFVVLVLGYMIGRINIKGVEFGSSGVFIAALIVGIIIAELGDDIGFNWGDSAPSAILNIKNLGLGMFVAGIGFIAGPTFIRNFKSKALSYLGLGASVTIISTIFCILLIALDKSLEPYQGAGILMGALSSTPGLSAAQGVFAENANEVAALSGLCYPFGVLGVVMFVQFMPRILRADMAKEIEKLKALASGKTTDAQKAQAEIDKANANKQSNANQSSQNIDTSQSSQNANISQTNVQNSAVQDQNSTQATTVTDAVPKEKKLLKFDPLGICMFSLAVALGMVIGSITIPLGSKLTFSLGTTGGALLSGLLFAHFGKIGKVSLAVPKPTLSVMRELGLVFFLTCSGIEGGFKFFEQFQWHFLLYGALLTVIPMILGFLIARFLFKLELLNNLGSICGAMTSTPALGALIHVSKTEDVAQSYAATYPIALLLLVFVPQVIFFIFA